MNITDLSAQQLRQAAHLKDQIATLEKQLAALTGPSAKTAAAKATQPVKKKGGMSAAGKARIAAAQKLRWAKIKAAEAAPKVFKPVKPARKKMSAEAKAKIAAAAKARWAKVKADKTAKK
jgi:hypothetical protein